MNKGRNGRLTLPNFSEESRFKKYLDRWQSVIEEDRDSILNFLQEIFREFREYVRDSPNVTYLPTTILTFCTTDQLRELERKDKEKGFSVENTRRPATSICVQSRHRARIYVDLEHLFALQKSEGAITFLYNLSEAYVHEILHTAFPQKEQEENQEYEQRIFDMQFPLLELFLEVNIPEERKRMRAKDFYR